MGFFNDIIADAMPVPGRVSCHLKPEALNDWTPPGPGQRRLSLAESGEDYPAELQSVPGMIPDPEAGTPPSLPEPGKSAGKSDPHRLFQESEIRREEWNEGAVSITPRQRIQDIDRGSSPDRRSPLLTADVKADSVSRQLSSPGHQPQGLSNSASDEASGEAGPFRLSGTVLPAEPVLEENGRQPFPKTNSSAPELSPETATNRAGAAGEAKSGMVDSEPTTNRQGTGREDQVAEHGDADISGVLSDEAPEQTLTDKENVFGVLSPEAPEFLPEELDHTLSWPERPQVSIGRIEVIVEVNDAPAAGTTPDKPASPGLASRYYLRRA